MIRPAESSDLPYLRALQEETLASPWPDLLELGAEAGPGPTVVVSTVDGEPVGYALAVTGEPADETETDVVYLAEIAVSPDHRREGRATALLDAVAERYADRDELRLTARADDEAALSFYRASGFWVLDELPDHYEDGDGVLLTREL